MCTKTYKSWPATGGVAKTSDNKKIKHKTVSTPKSMFVKYTTITTAAAGLAFETFKRVYFIVVMVVAISLDIVVVIVVVTVVVAIVYIDTRTGILVPNDTHRFV